MIGKNELTALAAAENPPAVSLYLPTHEKGREIRQDPIRLKNALTSVATRLGQSLQRREIDALLAPAWELIEDPLFWRHQRSSVAIFLAPGLFQVHKLPITVEEMQVIGPRPHIKPLLQLLAADGAYYCVAASAGDTRLYEGTRFGLSEKDGGLPRSADEVAAETEYQQLQHASPPARPRTAVHLGMPAHAFGDTPEEQRKTQLVNHLRRLGGALAEALGDRRVPVVLVAAPEVRGHLRALATDIDFVDEDVPLDPQSLTEDELHAKTYAIVQPLFTRARTEALEHFRARAGAGSSLASDDLTTIVGAARFGRVDTLFVAENAVVWGFFDEDADRIEFTAPDLLHSQDLTDLAALQTLLAGGTVHLLGEAEMPAGGPLLALLRY
jgi:hypothetical protein